ncbi:SMC-Scp complex subunit ScpB [Fructobacillus sp. M1-13]|uniref:Segregation and condensation protein B n=1 Tax=Fructobacillus papyriferae TaxID=2713171 RepID=A0ABS5QNF1_9LACO|nr:SMC-Scp complex subunit ScpB [Fructobacillus papyriferae]MBS9334644.1 SMC-Scp complex subunit ScpB [Fructobacillus papyriferae]MCD2158634.1 SMC-Scp complex subunit ScpB [Fructobacillus papyriferae]
MNAISQIEALLFVAGEDGLSAAELAKLTDYEKGAIPALVDELWQKLNDDTGPLTIRSSDGRYVLVTKPSFGQLVSSYFDLPINTKLTQPQLETLVIVAYQQPITRVEIDQIRGVRSAGTLQKLQLHQLIEGVGRKEEVGRPILYGTTSDFLDYFGLGSLDDLPKLPDINDVILSDEQQDEVALFDEINAEGDVSKADHNDTFEPDVRESERTNPVAKNNADETAKDAEK